MGYFQSKRLGAKSNVTVTRSLSGGALSVTADELFGIAQFYGPSGLYYFPIIGPEDSRTHSSTYSPL